MLREPEPSVERIKQEIDYNKEQLRFFNSLYIPVWSGMMTMGLLTNTLTFLARFAGVLTGCLFLTILSWSKKGISKKIENLIEKL